MIKIVIDTKGGDKGPLDMIMGAALALEKFDGISVLLVGDKEYIAEQCKELSMPEDRVEILDAPGEITFYDSPADALFNKTDSSMLRGLQTLSEREDLFGMITTGNTGVLITGAMRYLSGKN